MVVMEILSRISEELCIANQVIKVNWDSSENFIDKLVTEEPKISIGDFVRLIKNTIVGLRIKFEGDEVLSKYHSSSPTNDGEILTRNSSIYIPEFHGSVRKW
jgi:hypothetical protein